MANLKIFSIDDSKAVHAFLRECLKDSGHTLTTAPSGEDGLNVLSDKNNQFDLIFLDWEMPGLNGPEVLDKIKAMGIKSPVIMLTSKNDMTDIASMLDKGASEYVLKPFTRDIILEKIAAVMGG